MRPRLLPTISLLRRLPVVAGADELSLARLAALMSPGLVDAGRVLVGAGSSGRDSYVVVAGWAEVRLDGETVALLGPGRFVGGGVLGRYRAPGASVTSCTPMTLLTVDPESLSVVAADPVGARLAETGLDDRLRRLDALAAWHATG